MALPAVTARQGEALPIPTWRRSDIQGLRAVAVLAVITFHAGLPVPGGFTGVDVFFVISGYVITELIIRQRDRGDFSYRTFYARRAQRLLPALMVMILAVFIASLLWQSPFGAQQTTAQTGIGAVFLAANVVITRTIGGYFSAEAESNPLLHTWSLSVEEQFYLVFPLLLVTALAFASQPARRALRTRAPELLVGAVIVLSFAVGLLWSFGSAPLGLTSQPETWAFYLSPARAWEFGVGALLALLVHRGGGIRQTSVAIALALIGVALLLTSFFILNSEVPFPGFAALIPTVGTAALLLAGTSSNALSRGLSVAPMVRIGDWSYSLYLWHWPFIVFAALLWPYPWVPFIAALASFAPAVASYHFLENPIRNARLTRASVLTGSLAGVAVITIAGLGLWNFGSSLIPGINKLQQQQNLPTWSQERECFFGTHFDPARVAERCTNQVDDSQGWILLAGDSHAAAASSGVVAAAAHAGYSLFSVTGGACPLSLSESSYSDMDNCSEMNQFIWNAIDAMEPPRAVVLAEKGTPDSSAETLSQLTDMGIPVIWLRDVPRWAPQDQGIQHLPCSGGIVNFTCSFPKNSVIEFQGDTRAREDSLLANFPSVIPVDAWPLFCKGETCSSIQDGSLRFLDNEHLNRAGSELLQELMAGALEQAGVASAAR